MTSSFETTDLWKRSLGHESQNIRHIEQLRTAFRIFRDRVAHLLSKIAAAVPDLTVHDITHVDALWETASLIVGRQYPINPMEGFVLGGAMLLHDAAICFEAYDNGREGLRTTIQWQDALATERKRNEEREKPLSNPEMETAADFTALRLLHGEQATKLVEHQWSDRDGRTKLFLIDDSELRERYGSIIGQIAASHTWDIEEVGSRLPQQINAPGDWPAEWRIDPVKLACILRAADAAHIDNRRAPDFLYALARRQGISAHHWKAQNWLARVDLDQADKSGETLLFTSNKYFKPEDVDAWWVAYDAICLAAKEINSSNALLKSRPQWDVSPEFAVRRVAGVVSPELMSVHLRTDGWKPWNAELHVTNVQRLVQNFGGQKLYGHMTILLSNSRSLCESYFRTPATRLWQGRSWRMVLRE